jgi:curved DNA-binding protein CbpA
LNTVNELTDYYKLLNVPRNASLTQITAAFKLIAKDCSELMISHGEIKKRIEKEFSKYQLAFKTLTSKQEKEKYDLRLEQLESKEAKHLTLKREQYYWNKIEPVQPERPINFTFSKLKVTEF